MKKSGSHLPQRRYEYTTYTAQQEARAACLTQSNSRQRGQPERYLGIEVSVDLRDRLEVVVQLGIASLQSLHHLLGRGEDLRPLGEERLVEQVQVHRQLVDVLAWRTQRTR